MAGRLNHGMKNNLKGQLQKASGPQVLWSLKYSETVVKKLEESKAALKGTQKALELFWVPLLFREKSVSHQMISSQIILRSKVLEQYCYKLRVIPSRDPQGMWVQFVSGASLLHGFELVRMHRCPICRTWETVLFLKACYGVVVVSYLLL